MTFEEWLDAGISAGYCTRPVCDTHDGTMTLYTPSEAARFDAGGDPCIPVVRLRHRHLDPVTGR